MKTCDICEKEFKPFNSVELRCSKECKHLAKKRYDFQKRAKKIIKCKTCGVDFEKRHSGAKTCSIGCGAQLRENNKYRSSTGSKYETESELIRNINRFLLAPSVYVS